MTAAVAKAIIPQFKPALRSDRIVILPFRLPQPLRYISDPLIQLGTVCKSSDSDFHRGKDVFHPDRWDDDTK